MDVSVRDGQLRIVLTMTGNLAALTDSEPEELILHPADPTLRLLGHEVRPALG